MKSLCVVRDPIIGFALFIAATSAWCSTDNWSDQFPPSPQTDGNVLALASQGTTFYVGGDFTTVSGVNSPGIAKWNGTTWEAVGGGVNGTVYAIAISGTNVYIAGSFDQAGEVSALNIAAWNGSSWTALGGGIDDDANQAQINALAVNGATLYAAGQFDLADGNSVTNIASWNGTAWSALNNGLNYNPTDTNDDTTASVNALAFSGATLYAGGTFNLAGTKTVTNMAKWNGSSWSTVGSGLDYVPIFSSDNTVPSVNALAFIGTNLCAGGIFNASGLISLGNLAVWNGASWSSLGGPADDEVDAILVAATNKVYIGGAFATIDNVPANSIAQWNGANWNPLDVGSDGTVSALALTGNLLFAGGSFGTLGEANTTSIGQWDGISWAALGDQAGNSPDNQVNAITISGTNVYLGGDFVTAGGVTLNGIADWTGTAWKPLGDGIDGYVTALAVNVKGLYVGGNFTQDDVNATNITLWNGTAWAPLGPGVDDEVDAITSIGTTLYIGGQFLNAGTNPVSYIAKWDGTNWHPLGTGLDGPVSALQAVGTNLYVGGSFANAGGVMASNIARWDGVQWWPVGAGLDGTVGALALVGTNLYAGGSFDTTTNSFGNIAEWNGTDWNDVGGGIDGPVAGFATLGNVLFATGSFDTAGTNAASNIARWDGALWAPLSGGLDQQGNALAASGGTVYAGGSFMNAGNEASGNFAEWNDAPPSFWLTPNSPDNPLALGESFTLTVGATGDLPLTYQWQHNGTNIPGATSTSYTNASLQAGGVGNYTVLVTNTAGSAICDPAQVYLDSITVFSENFESGKMTNWTTVSGGTALTISTNESHSGTNSSICTISTAKMYHNLSVKLSFHARATFWIYDNNGTQNRWFGQALAYSGTGYGNGTLEQILAIGLYNTSFGTDTGDLAGDTVSSTNYQGEVYAGDNTGYFNLDQPPIPGRSVGWHEFQIERQADQTTVDFSVDGVLGQEIDDTTNKATWNTVTIGSVGSGTTNGNVWFDDIAVEYLDPPVITVEPTNQTANAGATVTFSATATGDGTLTYQWQHDGANIASATKSQLSLTGVNSGSAGDYTVSVQNGIGPVISDDATLALNTAPVIVTPPVGGTIPAGSSLALEVVAEGIPSALSYQWRANTTNISGAIYSEYDIYNAVAGQTNYSVVVTNSAGAVTSVVATVVVTNSLPLILVQPQSQSAVLGGNATFFVQAIGSLPRLYQWKFNNTNIAGATASAYRTPTLQTNNAGNYSVMVSNSLGVAVSSNALLTLDYPPVITLQPAGVTTPSGSNIFLTVTATGTPVLNYDWRKNGVDFQTSDATLELDDVQSSDSGTYSVIVYSDYGYAISSNAVLIVNGPPSILQQPQAVSTSLGASVVFSVAAVGSGTLTYQWRRDGAAVAGATASNYSIAAVTTNDPGVYSVTVGNPYGSTPSDDAFLTLTNYVVFYDGFETNHLTNWTIFTGATALSTSTNQANSGTNSALCSNSSQKMYHPLSIEVENHAISTFFIYDNQGTQNRWWGQALAYGGIFSNAPLQILAAGRYDLAFPANGQTGDMVGVTVDKNYYQAFVLSGTNTGYINLDGDGFAPTRSTGWHEFDIERLDDNVTINFYVDQTLAATVTDATPATWDAVTIGSAGTGATNGNVWFDDVLVQYVDPPDILADPQDVSVNLGQTASFNVWATGNVQSYQWLFNGTNLPGATATNLVIPNVQATNLGAYVVIVMNGVGPTESATAMLCTNTPPSITLEPQGLTALSGSAVSFIVEASGSDPLAYQWAFNTTAIAGETNTELDLPAVTYTNAGSYTVVITNAGGSITSTPAVLMVRPPAVPSLSSAVLGPNYFQMELSGETNGNYSIQGSTNLTNWTTLTNFTLTNGTFEFMDSRTNLHEFYRATGQ